MSERAASDSLRTRVERIATAWEQAAAKDYRLEVRKSQAAGILRTALVATEPGDPCPCGAMHEFDGMIAPSHDRTTPPTDHPPDRPGAAAGRRGRGGAVSERWIDQQGDVWALGADGLMHTPETRPFPREHVERKWGPLRLLPDPATPTRAGLPADRQETSE